MAGVSLLTGDIKIRAPPGTQNELIICTSEILRNKLTQPKQERREDAATRGKAQNIGGGDSIGMLDIDLGSIGCVVSDEIHYINDVERGTVWEETLMHLPNTVQMVALSATLRDPESFVAWLTLTLTLTLTISLTLTITLTRRASSRGSPRRAAVRGGSCAAPTGTCRCT